ncbi:MAG TPA: SIMPL domain-containing protein [Gaiellaceae bacterium]|jgi:hypothetical protein
MRRILLFLAAAAVVIAAAALSGVARPDTARGDTAPQKLVTTLGHGIVTTVPDVAVTSFGVRTESGTAADALARNADLMDRVLAALRAAGGEKLRTREVSLYPRTDDTGKTTGFVAQNTVTARAKIAAAGKLVDAAVGAGANTVEGPSLERSDRDALVRDALKKAVADAKAKAEAIAEAGGFEVGSVAAVTERGGEPQPVFDTAQLAAGKAETQIEPGTQEITADVTVSFEIR